VAEHPERGRSTTDRPSFDDSRPPVTGEHCVSGYQAGDTRFAVRTNVAAFAALFEDRFRDLATGHDDRDRAGGTVVFDVVRHSDDSHPWGIWRDGEPCETMLTQNYVLVHLVWEINRLVVERVGDRLAVHASAVARNGRAIVFPGASHAGKSTLAGWLVAHDWDYVTDEMTLVDTPSFRLTPYQRPIGVRPGGPLARFIAAPPAPFATFGDDEWLVPASTIGRGRLAAECAAVALVFPQYTPGAGASLRCMSGADALIRLTEQAPTRLTGGRATFRQLSALAQALPRWELVFDRLESVSSLLEPLLDG
jgi:hypothetical protein